jgi:hypothetical protein
MAEDEMMHGWGTSRSSPPSAGREAAPDRKDAARFDPYPVEARWRSYAVVHGSLRIVIG